MSVHRKQVPIHTPQGLMRDKGGNRTWDVWDMRMGVEAKGDLDEQSGPADVGKGKKPPGLAEAKTSIA